MAMRKALAVIVAVSVLVITLHFTLADSALAQPFKVKDAIENHLDAFKHTPFAKLPPVVVIDKEIQQGANKVAFNPNIGYSKVVSVLSGK